MQAHHDTQPYDVPSSQPVDGESMWTPSPHALTHVGDRTSDAVALDTINVHGLERLASGLVGGLLIARGIAAHGPTHRLMALLGSALVARGITGNCHLYRALGVDTAHPRA